MRFITWTVTSVLEQAYMTAHDNFAAFVTITLIFGAVALVMDILSLGLLAGIVHLVVSVATARKPAPSHRYMAPNFASQMRTAFSSMVWNTGPSSPGELEITRSTSEVAVC